MNALPHFNTCPNFICLTWLIFILSFHPDNSGSHPSQPVCLFGQYLQFMTVLQRKLQVCVMCIHQIWPRKHDGRLTKENLPLHANSWHNFHHLHVYVYLTTGYTGTTSSLYQKIAMFSLKIVGLYSRGHTLSTVLQSPLLMTFKSSRLVLNYNESHFH